MINLILNVTDNETKITTSYDAYLCDENNGEIYLKNDEKKQKHFELISDIFHKNQLIEVEYNGKTANVECLYDAGCLIVSTNEQKRLLNSSNKKMKK